MDIRDNALTVEHYTVIRQKAGFKMYQQEDVEIALKNTLFSVVAYDEDKPIGIARVVGDGRISFFIKDVVILREYQKQYVGKQLMERIIQYIDEKACEGAYVGLMCTPNTEEFYEKFGFIRRPSEAYGSGMVKFVNYH